MANVSTEITYPSSINSIDLTAEINYDDALTSAPIVVVMHGFSPSKGNFDNVRANAERMRDNHGYFAISVAMRGRDGAEGTRDSGGKEIYDIYDAVEYVKANYAQYTNTNYVAITGYSGGGGNVMACLVRFPDYFRWGSAFFGMSDYGYDTTNGWYFDGAAQSHKDIMDADIGVPATNVDKYMARAANLASQNNPYSGIYLFVNTGETTCPKINMTSFYDNAVAHGVGSNINVHIGVWDKYVAGHHQYWPHNFPTADEQAAAEYWYINESFSQPSLNRSGTLRVIGWVKTKHFELWVDDGDGVANLTYNLDEDTYSISIASSDKSVTSVLTTGGESYNLINNDELSFEPKMFRRPFKRLKTQNNMQGKIVNQ